MTKSASASDHVKGGDAPQEGDFDRTKPMLVRLGRSGEYSTRIEEWSDNVQDHITDIPFKT
jgi:hypothetical protein